MKSNQRRVPDREYFDHLRRAGAPHPEHFHFARTSAAEMAEALGWPYQKLLRRLQTGTLRATKVGDRWFFTSEQAALIRRRAALEDMLDTGRFPPAVVEALDNLDAYDSDCRLAEFCYGETDDE